MKREVPMMRISESYQIPTQIVTNTTVDESVILGNRRSVFSHNEKNVQSERGHLKSPLNDLE